MTEQRKSTTRRLPKIRLDKNTGRVQVVGVAEFDVLLNETDALGIVWHGHYLRYFEAARTDLERRLGIDLVKLYNEGFALPVVGTSCRFLSPMRYGDTGFCRAHVAKGHRRLEIAYELQNTKTDTIAATGATIQVAMNRETFELCMDLPESLKRCLEPVL